MGKDKIVIDKEPERLAALRSYRVMDTEPEPSFDRITTLAAAMFAAPIALISLVDQDRQWFKARRGLDACSTPREQAFCAHALALEPNAVMVVADATLDPRFADNPAVTGPPHVRFYAGAVLSTPGGANLGTLCIIDTEPRPAFSKTDQNRLADLAAIVVDQLEARLAHRLVSEQRRLLAMAEAMSAIGHWRRDLRTDAVTFSDEVYRIHGLTPSAGQPSLAALRAFIHPEDMPWLAAASDQAVRDGGGYEIEVRLLCADGRQRDVLVRAMCEVDDQGAATALFGVIQDVTEQRLALAAVRKGEARYRLLADSMADAVTRIRLDGSSDYISPAIEAVIGYTPGQMRGRTAQSFVYAPDRPLLAQTFAALADGQEEATVQLRAAHRNGHPVWVEVRFRLIRDAAGRPAEMVAVIRDIEDRKILEAQLRRARQDAEAAAAVKSEFLANMSHELRTPLNSIIGFTGLACKQADLPDLARQYVERVENASRALLCTVNDILDFSKLEAGHVMLKPAPTDAAALCRSTLDLLAPQAAAKDLKLTLRLAIPKTTAVLTDGDRVRQVLLNLVGNAVKFTESGEVTLEAGYDDQRQRLRIAVEDTGPGVTAEDRAKLFKRFSQVDGSATRGAGGTGLGLAICKGLVEAMGGEIGVDSTPGQGSRFWFVLPAPLCRLDALATAAAFGGGAAMPAAGVRVLVVDDHPANRDLAKLFLTGCGVEVTEARDGEAAVLRAADSAFDAILMDMRMPRLDGFGALRRIRASDGPNAATPVIAYTADTRPEEVARLLGLGFQSVVVKPVEAGQLLSAVAQATAFAQDRQPGLLLRGPS